MKTVYRRFLMLAFVLLISLLQASSEETERVEYPTNLLKEAYGQHFVTHFPIPYGIPINGTEYMAFLDNSGGVHCGVLHFDKDTGFTSAEAGTKSIRTQYYNPHSNTTISYYVREFTASRDGEVIASFSDDELHEKLKLPDELKDFHCFADGVHSNGYLCLYCDNEYFYLGRCLSNTSWRAIKKNNPCHFMIWKIDWKTFTPTFLNAYKLPDALLKINSLSTTAPIISIRTIKSNDGSPNTEHLLLVDLRNPEKAHELPGCQSYENNHRLQFLDSRLAYDAARSILVRVFPMESRASIYSYKNNELTPLRDVELPSAIAACFSNGKLLVETTQHKLVVFENDTITSTHNLEDWRFASFPVNGKLVLINQGKHRLQILDTEHPELIDLTNSSPIVAMSNFPEPNTNVALFSGSKQSMIFDSSTQELIAQFPHPSRNNSLKRISWLNSTQAFLELYEINDSFVFRLITQKDDQYIAGELQKVEMAECYNTVSKDYPARHNLDLIVACQQFPALKAFANKFPEYCYLMKRFGHHIWQNVEKPDKFLSCSDEGKMISRNTNLILCPSPAKKARLALEEVKKGNCLYTLHSPDHRLRKSVYNFNTMGKWVTFYYKEDFETVLIAHNTETGRTYRFFYYSSVSEHTPRNVVWILGTNLAFLRAFDDSLFIRKGVELFPADSMQKFLKALF